ncbi:383_t:CDS:2 [Funneliformis geosporum]|uniref:383_t:CDS:1 n=1 Tax=Funneliformis geosporum TaxID=1117311 RepID=A0A9W4SJF5_9GLOM|nr:383_t:CDS:2 [Funneliformis geosporum]
MKLNITNFKQESIQLNIFIDGNITDDNDGKLMEQNPNTTSSIHGAAEHNKKICGILLNRVQIADINSRNVKLQRDKNEEFFTKENLFYLQKLDKVVDKIHKFVEEITQITGLSKYIHAKNDHKVKSDIEDLSQYLKDIGSGITDINQNFSEAVKQINVFGNSLNEIIQANSNDFQSELLEYNDFEEVKQPLKNKYVRKFNRRKYGFHDSVALKLLADKNISEKYKSIFKSQVTILKKLKECTFIIQFYGLTSHEDKLYLVTEWANYGNLREHYQKHPLEVRRKLKFALDISKGLNFLTAVSILHRDIRAENILITDHETAKIANFKSSRAVPDSTQNQKATLEAIRYCAPEKLQNEQERIPYERFGGDIVTILDQVCNKKYRESFSHNSQLASEYQELAKRAVHHDHNFRPQFSRIFTTLQDLYKKKF